MIIFSIKNAFRKKSIAILSSIGIAVGLMLVFVVGAFTAGVTADFQVNLTKTLGLVNIIEKSQIGSGSQLPTDFPDTLLDAENIGDKILGYSVEAELPPYFGSNYDGKMVEDRADRLVIKGLNKTIDESWGGPTTKISSGRPFELGKNESIIDSRIVDVAQFNVSIGSQIMVNLDPGGITTVNLTIVGVYEQEGDGAPPFVPVNFNLYTDIAIAWDLLDKANETSNYYSLMTIRFNVESHSETEIIVDNINELSDSGTFSPIFVSAYSLAAFLEQIEETFELFNSFTPILSIVTVLAGGMAIIVTQLMAVSSRMKEFAILKATGWKNRHIFLNVIIESLTLSLLGAAIGLLLGISLILFFGSNLNPFGSVGAIITVGGVFEVIAYAVGLGILGGLYPGYKASKVRPVIVLKGE